MFRTLMLCFAITQVNVCLSNDIRGAQAPAKSMEERLHDIGIHGHENPDGTWEIRFEDELPAQDAMVEKAMGTKEKPGLLRKLKVKSLQLWNSEATAKSIRLIAELPDVEELILSGTHVDEEGMKAIAKMPNLHALMPGINVPDSALVHLANHKKLDWLDLQTCIVEAKAIDALVTIKGLKTLDISNQTWLTPESLKKLAQIKGLERLYIKNADIDDAKLKALSGITSLKVLDLDFNEGITGSGFEHVSGLDSLEVLAIYQVPFQGQHIKHLKRLRQLRAIYLYGKSQRFELADFSVLSDLKHLEKIVVGECKKSEEGERKLAKALPKTAIVYLGE